MIYFIIFILGNFCGVLFTRYTIARLKVASPLSGNLELRAFLLETVDSEREREDQSFLPENSSLILSLENKGDTPIQLESWSIRVLGGQGSLKQLFVTPQNLIKNLPAKERTTVEVHDLDFLFRQPIHTIVIRDIYGKEWSLSKDQINHVKKDLFWSAL